jgi:hypothetical protein
MFFKIEGKSINTSKRKPECGANIPFLNTFPMPWKNPVY